MKARSHGRAANALRPLSIVRGYTKHAEGSVLVAAGDTRVQVRAVAAHTGALEVFVHSPDRDGLFAAIVAVLDRCGLAIQQARVLDGPNQTIFDTFEVVPVDARHAPATPRKRRSAGW